MRSIAPLTLLLASPHLATALPSSSSSSSAKPLPLVIWHGLGDNYANDGLINVGELAQQIHPGTEVYIVRLGDSPDADRQASFFGNLTDHVASVCEALATHPVLGQAQAIDAIGFSQGGLFLRGYVERCNDPPVRSLVTFGSPHNGIADFQKCGATDWLCKGAFGLLRANTWSSFVQGKLVPAQYYRIVDAETGEPEEVYLNNSNYLADVNNERERKNRTYKRNLASLKSFVMYMFAQDSVLIPKESSWFGQVNNLTLGVVTPLQNRTIYKEDWLGLKWLDQSGKLVFRKIDDEHMHIQKEHLETVISEFFGPIVAPMDEQEATPFVDQEEPQVYMSNELR